MQKVVYTQKPMRVPNRGSATRKKLEMQHRAAVAGVVLAITLLLAAAVVTGLKNATPSPNVRQISDEVIIIQND